MCKHLRKKDNKETRAVLETLLKDNSKVSDWRNNTKNYIRFIQRGKTLLALCRWFTFTLYLQNKNCKKSTENSNKIKAKAKTNHAEKPAIALIPPVMGWCALRKACCNELARLAVIDTLFKPSSTPYSLLFYNSLAGCFDNLLYLWLCTLSKPLNALKRVCSFREQGLILGGLLSLVDLFQKSEELHLFPLIVLGIRHVKSICTLSPPTLFGK